MSFKVREAHWQIMVGGMEKHPFLATGKFVGPRGKELYKKHWVELAHNLDALGYGAKPTEKWQKAAAMRTSLSRTGGALDDVKSLSELNLKILDLLGENFVGLINPECGVYVGVTVSHEQVVCENILEEPSISNTMPQKENMEPPPKRQKINFHNECKETIEELRDIKNTIKSSLSEISSNLKDVATEIKTMNNYLPQLLGGQVIFEEQELE